MDPIYGFSHPLCTERPPPFGYAHIHTKETDPISWRHIRGYARCMWLILGIVYVLVYIYIYRFFCSSTLILFWTPVMVNPFKVQQVGLLDKLITDYDTFFVSLCCEVDGLNIAFFFSGLFFILTVTGNCKIGLSVFTGKIGNNF